MKTKILLSVLTAGALLLIPILKFGSRKGKTINLSFLKGPTGMGGAYLWTRSDLGKTANVYNISLDTDPTEVGKKLADGEYDIACIPANLAAALYESSGRKIKVIAVNTLGMLHIVTKNSKISSVKDLEGKTILSAGKGTVAEYALNYVLNKNNVNAHISFTSEHSETVKKAIEYDYDTLLLPEPFASLLTQSDSSFSLGLDITDEWKKAGGSILTMGCVAVNSDFYYSNKKAVNRFIEEYRESVNYVNNNKNDAAILIDAHSIMSAAIAKQAIPKCNIVCFTNNDMETAMSLCDFVGMRTVDADFYIHTD